MAYVSKERKAAVVPNIKKVLGKYGVKGTIKVLHHATLCVTLRKIPVGLFSKDQTDLEAHRDVNVYHIDTHYQGRARDFLNELLDAMKGVEWYDRSDSQCDHFDTAWYNSIYIGEWNKAPEVISS
jgi:hypothetical protein